MRYLSLPVVPLPLGYDPLLQLVHEQDLLDAFERALLTSRPGVFNVVGSGVLPVSTLFRLARKRTIPLPSPLLDRVAYYPSQRADRRSPRGVLRLSPLPLGGRRAARLGRVRRARLLDEGGLDLLRVVAAHAPLPVKR